MVCPKMVMQIQNTSKPQNFKGVMHEGPLTVRHNNVFLLKGETAKFWSTWD
jgi:hypothetical protein